MPARARRHHVCLIAAGDVLHRIECFDDRGAVGVEVGRFAWRRAFLAKWPPWQRHAATRATSSRSLSYTGLRWSELVGLRVGDIDLVARPTVCPRGRAGSGRPDHRRVLAGTAVDILNGLRACDPKRLAIYFTKHSSPNNWATRNTSTSSPNRGANPATGQVGSGGFMGCTAQLQ